MSKVATVDLEAGRPTVEEALSRLRNAISTHKKQGRKALILIHGYGSSGEGGKIRSAVRRELSGNLGRMVRDMSPGEEWHEHRGRLLGICKALEEHQRRIASNDGVTVVIL